MEDRYICPFCSGSEQPFAGKCPRCGTALKKVDVSFEAESCCCSSKKVGLEKIVKETSRDLSDKVILESVVEECKSSPPYIPWYKRLLSWFSCKR